MNRIRRYIEMQGVQAGAYEPCETRLGEPCETRLLGIVLIF